MLYDRVQRSLGESDGPAPAFATFPDGSVDRFCSVSTAGGRLESRAAFARAIDDLDRSTFRVTVDAVEPGGQSVNAAQQLHALGGDVTCYGHCDHAVFEELPFPAVSMGEPAHVEAFNLADGDVMFVEREGGGDWTLDDLADVADLDDVFAADAVCCCNRLSYPGLDDAFRRLGELELLPRVPVVVDPGDITGSSDGTVEGFREALAALQATVDVIYSGNPGEVRTAAGALADDTEDLAACARSLRDATGIAAVVSHGRDRALAATADGTVTVENLDVDRAVRHTGGGDRFTGGLAFGRARGWSWEEALACGNACASHYVATGETGGAEDLAAFLGVADEPVD